ncbi:hypothetical protein SAY87_016723 [Trapa incisa]|uniref:Glucosidase 2 subunit beta n=1 Tax=Trapa incisa TaxID=236973 RepID=A0AAN7QVK7_9MYRT|nr:hypothetical protein SAY87_016723 [Trapa incisa]
MNLVAVFIHVLVVELFLSFDAGSAHPSLPADQFLGISPEDVVYYKSSDFIKCKDGSKKFSKVQLNDDFCDCRDGTDEPGTSACPSAKFYCRNAGHTGTLLFSSRVNDGICDCCDGSDEYDGKVKCKNTCWEAGKVARDRLKKKISTFQQGVAIRKHEVEQARRALIKEEEELTMLKNEQKALKKLVERVRDRKEQIEKAEEKERLHKEKEEKARKEAEDIADKERRKIEDELEYEKSREIEQGSEVEDSGIMFDEKIGLMDNSPPDQHTLDADNERAALSKSEEPVYSSGSVHNCGVTMGIDQSMPREDNGPETDELSKEELGKLVASRWTGEKIEKESEADPVEDNNPKVYDHEEIPEDTYEEEDGGYDSEPYYEEKKDEYGNADNYMDKDLGDEDLIDENIHYHSESEDELDSDMENSLSWLEKIQRTIRNILQTINAFCSPWDKSGLRMLNYLIFMISDLNLKCCVCSYLPFLSSEAARVRKEYDELSTKLSNMQSRISSLSKKIKLDFGPEKEFYSLYGHCFETKENKYVYKVCPFKQATQEEGYSKTRLGRWDKFDDSYRTMIFSGGDNCWNGPNRSLKVRLRCGLKYELTDVDEPSRCEYEALLSTPALCSEDRLKELEGKLDLMNQEKPNSHDEL